MHKETDSIWEQLEPLLDRVEKPARYIGLELGSSAATRQKSNPNLVSWLLCYPDTYEIGLPNQGLQILYEILNEREDARAERAYSPWGDLDALMRSKNLGLFSVDTHSPAHAFDILAFNLAAELVYTNVLNCINLAGLPLKSADRGEEDMLVAAGGHCAYNPEPLADFVDFFVMGDGEEIVGEITEVVSAVKKKKLPRSEALRQLAALEGVYVPQAYKPVYEGEAYMGLERIWQEAPALIERRVLDDLSKWDYPKNQLVPLTEVVHDRLSVEVFRGCTRGCRFCQAGMITRPVRERPLEQVNEMVRRGIERTGYDEIALTSLSTADFSHIQSAVESAMGAEDSCSNNISVSLPSLRVDAFTVQLASQIREARRSGLTLAPEAGSWRLRNVVNKLITEEDLYSSVESAFSSGWRRLKLYFLTGLPTEMDEDTTAIAELAENCVNIGRQYTKQASITVSLGGFVPKPHTPFQWFGQNSIEELSRKIFLVKDQLKKSKSVRLKWHNPKASYIEGLASRGDRRAGAVIQKVWEKGGIFQEWSEHFDLNAWEEAAREEELSMDYFITRHRQENEALPWDHISAGLRRDFLWQDFQDALAEHGIEDCRWTPCYDCGACTDFGVEHIVAANTPPAGGSQGTAQDLARGSEVPVRFKKAGIQV